MTRAATLLVAMLVLATTACGGGEQKAQPAIPARLAQDLARRADAIASSFEAGDVCGAAKQADALSAAVSDAIDGGGVPRALQPGLEQTSTELVNEINCPPPEQTLDEQSPAEPQPTEGASAECEQLEEQRQALVDEKDATDSKGKRKHLERDIEALEEKIAEACGNASEGEG